MKRTLLAMAVGAAFLPLVAQAAPEFYGRLNVSLDNVASSDAGYLPTAATPNSWDVTSTQSWVGIRGDVALYNQNLKAIYQVERGLDITTNTSGADLSTRNSFVGLAGDDWGRVFFGNYDGVVKKAEGKFDQFNHTVADMQFTGIGGQNRYGNTINYSSANMSGLTFNAQFVPGEGNINDNKGNTDHGLADGYGASVNFTQDTFWANLAYEKSAEDIGLGNPVDNKLSTLRITAGMNIGNIDVAALIQQRKNDTTNSESQNQFGLSGAFALTDQLKLKAQYINAEGFDNNFVKKNDQKLQSWTLGADYALGKNVTSYVLYSQNSIDGKNQANAKDKSEYNVASVGLTLKF